MTDQPIFIEGETGADQSARLGLLPCPFCAGPPALFCEEKTFTFNGRSDTHWDCHVFCHECGATAENSHLAWDLDVDASKDDSARYAIKAWQQRDTRHAHLYPYRSEIETEKHADHQEAVTASNNWLNEYRAALDELTELQPQERDRITATEGEKWFEGGAWALTKPQLAAHGDLLELGYAIADQSGQYRRGSHGRYR